MFSLKSLNLYPFQEAGRGESRVGVFSTAGLLYQEAPICPCEAALVPCLTEAHHMTEKEPPPQM